MTILKFDFFRNIVEILSFMVIALFLGRKKFKLNKRRAMIYHVENFKCQVYFGV